MLKNFTGTGAPLTGAAFKDTVDGLGTSHASLWAVLTVETSGFGFLPDRRPKIRYERHVFHKRTSGRFSRQYPDISSPDSGGTTTVTNEYVRLDRAMSLDRQAALESTSWGLGQIMGFNARKLGYTDAEEMATEFIKTEDAQLDGVRRFVMANQSLANALKNKEWKKFAFFYNGAGFVKNAYDKKLQQNEEVFSLHGMPDLDVRALQAKLTYLDYSPGPIDGILGNATRRAILAFQKASSIPLTAAPNPETLSALSAAASAAI